MANTEIDFCAPSIIRKLRIFNANLREFNLKFHRRPIKFCAAEICRPKTRPRGMEIKHKRKVENILQLSDPFGAFGQIKLAPSQTSINQQPRILEISSQLRLIVHPPESIYNICKLYVQRGVWWIHKAPEKPGEHFIITHGQQTPQSFGKLSSWISPRDQLFGKGQNFIFWLVAGSESFQLGFSASALASISCIQTLTRNPSQIPKSAKNFHYLFFLFMNN